MSVSLSIDGPGDAELISAVRGGDVDAYGELFARHVDAARRLARQLTGPADADDLVSDAFTKVLTVLQRGGGPDLAFRAYLLTAVRRLHVDKIRAGSRLRSVDDLTPFDPGLPFQDTAVEGFDNAAAARAFASLPERWQMVLWHTEVEQQKPADIAPLLGMSANSVSALAYRAREGLRQAFLSQHATDPDDVDCAWTRDHLGAYVRGGLSRRDTTRVDDHLAACRACAAVYLELTEVNGGLAALLAPLLLGSAGAGYLSSGGIGSAGTLSSGAAAAKAWAVSHASLTAVGGMVVTATAVISIYGVTHFNNHPAADLGSPPLGGAAAVASTLPTTGPSRSAQPRTADRGRHGTPGVDKVADRSLPSRSTAPVTSPTLSDESTAPVIVPTTPTTSQPTDPVGPTDPTTGPTDPTGVPISFTSSPPKDRTFGSTYQLAATGGSGGTVTFSVDPTTTHDACSMVGAKEVRFDHAGTCVIAADNTSRSASRSASVTQTIEVSQEEQQLEISSAAPEDAAVGGTPYTVAAKPGATGKPVIYTGDGGCFVSGDTVTFQHADSCTVTAHQDGNHDYFEASDTQTFEIGKGSQTISFSLSAGEVPDTAPLDATASSGLPVDYSVDSSTTDAACRIVAGPRVSFDHAGTCVIDAEQTGNPDYNEAPRVIQSVEVTDESVSAHMEITLPTQSPENGKGQVQVTVHVTGLPSGSRAILNVTIPGTPHVEADSACVENADEQGAYACEVTQAGDQSFDFVVTVNQQRPTVTFDLAPKGHLILDNDSITHQEIVLGDDPAESPVGRSFSPRTR